MKNREEVTDDLLIMTGGLLPDLQFEYLLNYVLTALNPEQAKHLRVQWDLLPAAVRNDLREAYPEDVEDSAELEVACRSWVAEMTPQDCLDAWLRFNGIINYTGTIVMAWSGIRSAMR